MFNVITNFNNIKHYCNLELQYYLQDTTINDNPYIKNNGIFIVKYIITVYLSLVVILLQLQLQLQLQFIWLNYYMFINIKYLY